MSTGGPSALNNGGIEPPGPTRLGGRYELGELLGIGGMAVVRLATDVRLNRPVAVKMLRGELAESPDFQARFRRESRAAAALDHPSVVSVYDAGDDVVDGARVSYIVMEYVPGQTLRDSLRAGALDPRRALEITADLLGALEASHRCGIVHRDVKPANVMITPDGAVKVMDFGVARAVTDMSTSVTKTAAVIGTAHYLSPEQARGETVDARSDLYSTGCLLYELLTGRPPFQGDSAISVAYQHVRENPSPPSTFAPGLPPEIDSVVLAALAKRPDERYQTAEQMRAAILDVLAGRLPAAFPAGDAATVVVGQGSGTNGDAWTTQETPAVDLPTGAPKHRSRRKLALLAAAAVVLLAGGLGAFAFNALGEDQPVGRQAGPKVAPRSQNPDRPSSAPSEAAAFDVTDTTSSEQDGGTRVQPRRVHPTPSSPSTNKAAEPSPEPEQTEPTRTTEPEASPTPSPTPEESTPADTSTETPPEETQEPTPEPTPPATTPEGSSQGAEAAPAG
jgi:eukaryotic-like serine/threonine-protein kinase